jgi:hypothetical protein
MRNGIRIIAAVAAAACLAAAGCSRGGGAASFDGVFEKLRKAKTFDEAKPYYTAGTVDAVERAVSEGAISKEGRLRVLPLFNAKTSWEELSRTVSGDRGTIRIRYTDHPVENMIGVQMDFKMVREKGSWKIDLEDGIRASLGGTRGGAEEYLRRIRKGY